MQSEITQWGLYADEIGFRLQVKLWWCPFRFASCLAQALHVYLSQDGVNGAIVEDMAAEAAKSGQVLLRQADVVQVAAKSANDIVSRRLPVASDREASSMSTLPYLPAHQRVLQELHGFCASGGNCGMQEEDPAARIRAGHRPGPRRRLDDPLVQFETRSIFVKGIGRVKKNEFCDKHRLFNFKVATVDKGTWKAVKVRDDTNWIPAYSNQSCGPESSVDNDYSIVCVTGRRATLIIYNRIPV